MYLLYCSLLANEINAYDAKTKELEKSLDDKNMDEGVVSVNKIRDYKKTSLLKPVNTFDEFLKGLVEKNGMF